MRCSIVILLSALLLPLAAPLHAQLAETASESTIKAKQDTAWAMLMRYHKKAKTEIQQYREKDQTTKADSVRRTLGDRLYQYHREYRNAETGNAVLQRAFAFWGEAGEIDRIHEALPYIDRDSEGWRYLIYTILNAHVFAAMKSGGDTGRARQEGRKMLVSLLHELNEHKLPDARSRSVVLRQLGMHYRSEGNITRAQRYFEEMIRLQADSSHVAKAMGALYEIENLRIGQSAPSFTAETIEGDTLKLSDLKDKVVLLKFWATWCAPCIPEIPYLQELQNKYGDKNFQLVGVSLDDDLSHLEQFVDERGMTWPQIWQEKAEEGPVAALYNVTSVPDSYLIDQSGKIVAKEIDAEDLDDAVSKLLVEQK